MCDPGHIVCNSDAPLKSHPATIRRYRQPAHPAACVRRNNRNFLHAEKKGTAWVRRNIDPGSHAPATNVLSVKPTAQVGSCPGAAWVAILSFFWQPNPLRGHRWRATEGGRPSRTLGCEAASVTRLPLRPPSDDLPGKNKWLVIRLRGQPAAGSANRVCK